MNMLAMLWRAVRCTGISISKAVQLLFYLTLNAPVYFVLAIVLVITLATELVAFLLSVLTREALSHDNLPTIRVPKFAFSRWVIF